MKGEYTEDRRDSDRVMPSVQGILLKRLKWHTTIAPEHIDISQAADLIADTGDRLAVRVRSPGYLDQWPHDFTIRAARTLTGAGTEYVKIVDQGFGDFIFYGHRDDKYNVVSWRICNLYILRRAIQHQGPEAYGSLQANPHDGVLFWAFDVRKLLQHKWPVVYDRSVPTNSTAGVEYTAAWIRGEVTS
jgi:hypothetical protein